MTLQERRDKMVGRLLGLIYRIEDKEFGNSDFQCVDIPALSIVADFILSEQAKAVKEVVEPLKITTRLLEDGDSQNIDWKEAYQSLAEGVDQALSKAREYTEVV